MQLRPLSQKFLIDAQSGAMQVRSEIEEFQQMAMNDEPRLIAEIGTANGGTIGRWFQIPTAEHVISLDLPGGIHGGVQSDERARVIAACEAESKDSGIAFTAINGNSHEDPTTEKFRQVLNGRKLDVLFIDADHTYYGVKADFRRYAPFVKEGGLIGFHDVVSSPFHYSARAFVDIFWNEMRLFFRQSEINHTVNKSRLSFGGIGVIRFDEQGFTNYVREHGTESFFRKYSRMFRERRLRAEGKRVMRG